MNYETYRRQDSEREEEDMLSTARVPSMKMCHAMKENLC